MKPHINKLLYFTYALLVPGLLLFSFNYAIAQRYDTPDGERTQNHFLLKSNSGSYRFTTTSQSLYITKYSSANGWGTNKLVFMIPTGKSIKNIWVQTQAKDKHLVTLLANNGNIYKFNLDSGTGEVDPNYSVETGPSATGNGSYKKIITNGSIYVHFSSRLYTLRAEVPNAVWIVDTLGLKGASINDITLKTSDKSLVAATSKGLFSKSDTGTFWKRITSFDSTLSCNSIFISKKGNYYTGTQTRGPFFSNIDVTSWQRDTLGFGNTQISKFSDKDNGEVFGMNSNQLFRQMSQTSKWERIDTNLKKVTSSTPQFNDISSDETLDAATNYGSYSSSDNGLTWSPAYTGVMSESIYGLIFLSNDRVLTCTSFGVFYRDGLTGTWKKTFPVSGFISSGKNLKKDNLDNIYFQDPAGSSSHQPATYVSKDKGLTWNLDTNGISKVPLGSGFIPTTYYVSPAGYQYYGVGSTSSLPARVFSQNQNAEPWVYDTTGTAYTVPKSNQYHAITAFGDNNFNTVYHASYAFSFTSSLGSYLYKKNNNENLWNPDTLGLSNTAVASIKANKKNEVYLGTFASGNVSSIFRKVADKWTKINVPPAATVDAKYIEFDENNNLYVGFGPYYSGSGSYRGIYFTSDNGVSWLFAGLDSVTVNGLSAKRESMYAYTTRGAYLLTLSDIKAPVLEYATKIINFPLTSKDAPKDTIITLNNTGNDTLRVSNIFSTNTSFYAISKSFKIAPGSKYDLTIRFAPTANQVFSATMYISSNTYPDSILVKGEGTGYKYPKLALSSKVIDFGTVQGGTTKDTIIKIKNIGEDTLKISQARSYNSAFTTSVDELTVLPGEASDLKISYTPKVVGTVNSYIRITSNVPNDTILVSGNCLNLDLPIIQLSTKIIDFGKRDINFDYDTTVVIMNIGTDTLKVSNVRTFDGIFTIQSYPKVLSVGEWDTIHLRFSPKTAVIYNGIARITSNIPNDTIRLTGEGVSGTGVSDHSNNIDFVISPNPATDNIDINVPVGVQLAVPRDIEIYDIMGERIQTTPSTTLPPLQAEGELKIDVSGLVPGVYFVKIGDRVQRFVKM